MLSLYRTLSLRYLSRRWFRALLIVASIMLGVATLVATQALNDTMGRAALLSSNPVAGIVDFIVTNGEFPIDRDLVKDIESIPGVKKARPRIFDNARLLVGGDKKNVMILGIEMTGDAKEGDEFEEEIELDPLVKKMIDETKKADPGDPSGSQRDFHQEKARYFNGHIPIFGDIPAILGKELDTVLKDEPNHMALGWKILRIEKNLKTHNLLRVATIKPKADGHLAALGGYVVILGLDNAATVLGIPAGKVRRIDVALQPGVDLKKARKDLEAVLHGRAELRTIEEHNQALQSATVGMKTGFSMCGIAALIVGMFLVYNSLSVGVAERRHEIGILLSLGATRDQVWRLFAGEAFVLGCVGSTLGIPLGLGLAYLGLQPMQDAVGDVFQGMNLQEVELTREVTFFAFVVGILSAVLASLIPAIQAAYEKPAEAVHRVPKEPTVAHVVLHIVATLLLILTGMGMILIRAYLPSKRWGTYGGLGLVMVGVLLAAPLCAHLAARALVPISRRFFPIQWRLAADNLVRAPGRTGLVIGALAAGVCLVVETSGIIESNKRAIREWVDTSIAADLIITSGSPVGSGGQTAPMDDSLRAELCKIEGVEEALPVRMCNEILFRDVRIALMTTVADRAYIVEKKRLTRHHDVDLLNVMAQEENAVIISENFAALHHFRTGDYIALKSPGGEVKLHIIGTMIDYTWNLGTIVMNRRDYVKHWKDESVTLFDVYLRPGANPDAVKHRISTQLGAQFDLHPLTRTELQVRINEMIERLYGVAIAQQIVVMIVAALGVVMALLISVLQRRREMGLLRAIGASQAQVIYLVLTEAFLMGIFGTVIGALFAVPLQWYALQIVFLEESGYYFPVFIPWFETSLIALMAMAIATLAGLGPAFYAVRQRIPEAIAYE